MVRVMVRYPAKPGSRFDLDYYLKRHMPMVVEKLTPYGMASAEVDQGVSGPMPGTPAGYQMIAYLNFPSLEQMQAALMAEAGSLMADLANFTDVAAEVQINRKLM